MEKMQHFSIRKLSIGAASVLIGISFLGVKASTVKADALQNASATELTQSKAANEVIKQDADSNIKQEPTSDIKQEPVSKTDAKQITSDQPNTAQTSAQPASPKPNSNQQNAADLEAKPQTPDKVKLQSNRTITPNEAGQSKVEATALMVIAGKKLNAQMLSESKVMTPTKDTNGGFDEATWGKLNVNDWTIKALTDTDVNGTLAKSGNLELISYNGDEQHVIIPNLLDIYNAGKADSAVVGNLANEDSTRVVISKDLLSQFSKNATSIAFSKTHTDHISNKDVNQMSSLTKTGIDHLTKVYSKDSDLSSAFSHFHSYDGVVSTEIYTNEAPRVKLDATNFDVSNVTNMTETFAGSNYDGLSTIANWDTANATTMSGMFINANLSDLRFLSRWNTANVTDMSRMFMNNHLLTNLVPLADWNTGNVTEMDKMFLFSPISYADLSKWDFSKIAQYVESDGGAPGLDSFLVNYNDPSARDNTTVYLGNNKTIPSWVLDMSNGLPNYCIFRANENTGNYVIITSDPRLLANSNGAYNHLTFTDNTGKQTKVDIPMAISTENATGDFASVKQRVLDFVNAEVAKQTVPTGKKWVMTDTDLNDPVKIANANFKLIDTSLPVLNTNDAYALDSKNGLHEHANVNDNGGYDKDYWGAIDLNNWNYAQDDTGNITLEGYKGSDNTKIIVPNIADFAHGNAIKTITLQVNPNVDTDKVYISSNVMHDLAHNATRIGLSKTENKKVAASDAVWQNAFGGLTNGPSGNNSDGGVKVLNPNLSIMDLHNLDTSNITDMSAMFNGGTNLKTVGGLSDWNTSKVTNMDIMFQLASSLINIGNLDNWNTSNVTDMNRMFAKTSNLTNIGNLSRWDTSKVTNMQAMFGEASNLTNIGDLDDWKTGNVTDMSWMFNHTSNLTNIGDLSKWNTSKVTDMTTMFQSASSLTNIGNLDNWKTGNVADMSFMFNQASNLTNIGDLSKWDTGKVTDMNAMFQFASSLTNIGNLNNWNTSNVTDMNRMFNGASNLTNIGDLSKWDTSKVTNMQAMFVGIKSLHNLNISNWNLAKLTDKEALKYIFANDVNLTVIANNITLPAWYDNELNNSDYFWNNHIAVITNVPELIKATGDINNLKIDDQDASRSIFYNSKGSSDAIKVLTDANNQYIADYNKANPTKVLKLADTVDQNDPIALANASFVTVTYKLVESNTNDAFALDSKNGLHEHVNVNDNGGYDSDFWGKINVDNWNYTVNGDTITINGLKDGVSTGTNDTVIVPNLDDFKLAGKDGGAKTVYISSSALGKTAKHKYYGLSKTNDNKFATDSDISNAFSFSGNLTHVDLNSLNTSNVTDMNAMFNSDSHLTSLDVSNWDTSNVTDMSHMFSSAPSLTSLDVSNWDTSKVTNMRGMFRDALSLTSIDVSKWKTGNVTDMGYMFSYAKSLTDLDVSHWDTGNVTNMYAMFSSIKSLTSINVLNWDTSKVTNMGSMFNSTSNLTSLDVSNWNTGTVTDMSSMFSGASSLTDLNVSNWNTGTVTDMSSMFYSASSLTSLDVSKWDTGKVTDMSSMFYSASSLALIANGDKFADYLVKNNFADSKIDSDVKSVTTDNAKLLQLLTNDSQHDSATRTIVFTFPTNYSPDLTKYHLIKVGNTYQIKQSADYDKSYVQGTVVINTTGNINYHYIDATKPYKLSDTWQPNYDKLVLAHKNADGSVSFDTIRLPKVPGYKAIVKTVANPINPASALFAVSFMALPKPATPAINDTKPAETVTPAKPIKAEAKVTVAHKVIDLSDNAVTVTPKETTWQVANESDQDIYQLSNGKYTVELPHISNAQLHVIANDSTKDSVLFAYKGQNSKYAFKIKFVNGHYLLTTYKIKSGKLVKLIDYNFTKSSKMIDVILDWIKLK